MATSIFRENGRIVIEFSGISANRGRYARIELDILKLVGALFSSALNQETDSRRISCGLTSRDFTNQDIVDILKVLANYCEPVSNTVQCPEGCDHKHNTACSLSCFDDCE